MKLKEFDKKRLNIDLLYAQLKKVFVKWDADFDELVKAGKIDPNEYENFLKEKIKNYEYNF